MTTIAAAAAVLQQEFGAEGMKLQKILYYAQAAALVQRGLPLFSEEFQAWRHGPVNRDIWDGQVMPAPLPAADVELLRATWAKYGHLTAYELSDLSHEDAPWKDTRGDLPAGANCDRIISQEAMQAFYLGRELAKGPDGKWVHVPPTAAQWARAKAQLVIHRQARQGTLRGVDRRTFIDQQVIATQRLEGLAVSLPGMHG
ncbi:Panacea domain-containing protein [Deinococcus arcticus]|nr:Panacea domain-containing protein [Deinococcus arcticus]